METWIPDLYFDKLMEKKENAGPELKQNLVRLLGGFPEVREELAPILLERVEHHGYIQERVSYETDSHLRVPAYVLIPSDADQKSPAVVAWHGHGYGSREAVGLYPDGTRIDSNPGIHKRFALELVKRGMIVLVPEIIGFGDRMLSRDQKKDPRKNSSCFMMSARLLMLGKTLAGLRTYEAIRSIDYLCSRKDVDHSKIGTMGFSGGGLIAAFSALLDARIRATVLSAFTSTFSGSILHINHCIDNYIPSILNVADLPELIGGIAPRALFVESGEQDPLFPVSSFNEAVSRISGIYEKHGKSAQFDFDLFPGKHEISGRKAFDWLSARLA